MSKWTVPIDRLAKQAGDRAFDAIRQATYQLFTSVVFKSPIGNPDLWKSPPPPGYVGGRFRSNWNVTYGAPDYTYTDSTNISRGEREPLKALTLPVGGIVYLSNGLPYAQRLEYGYSKEQTPLGMIRTSVAEFNQFVDRALA